MLSPDGSFSEIYNKTHIPPGERYDIPGGTFPVIETKYGKLASWICADGNYTDITREITKKQAQLIAAPYREFPGFGEQLWQNVTFRAVENQVSMVVTGAASVAAIIDPFGRQVALDVNKSGSAVVLVADVPLGTGMGTLYTSLGDILGWAAFAGLICFTIYEMVEEQRFKRAKKRERLNPETAGLPGLPSQK